jgi:hypothetical protein
MADGVRRGLFNMGMLSGGLFFVILSAVTLIDDGAQWYLSKDLPWILVLSLLVSLVGRSLMIENVLRDEIRKVVKRAGGTLTIKLLDPDY